MHPWLSDSTVGRISSPAPALAVVSETSAIPQTVRKSADTIRILHRTPSLADAVHSALACFGRQLRGERLELAAQQVPNMPAIAEAQELLLRSLHLLVELSGTRRGAISVVAHQAPGREVLVMLRFAAQGSEVGQGAWEAFESCALFDLAEQTGTQVICSFSNNETVVGLRMRLPEPSPFALWA